MKDAGGLCQEYHRRATGKDMRPHPGRATEALEPTTFGCDCDGVGDDDTTSEVFHTVKARDGRCPPAHHLMPDGACMPDNQMPGYATYLAAATELGVTCAAC